MNKLSQNFKQEEVKDDKGQEALRKLDDLGLPVVDKTLAFTPSMYRSVTSSAMIGVENFIARNRENLMAL